MKQLTCHHCNKICKNNNSWRNHVRCCPKNPNRNYKNGMLGRSGGNQYTKAKETGIPYIISDETRQKWSEKGKSRTHTEETKKKISIKRRKYLEENPDKVPYLLNHYSKGKSYAEQYWQDILDKHCIEYVAEYRMSVYSLDFAIPDKKIDLEIDGNQHYQDNRIIESDKRRNNFLESKGWTVIRVNWSQYQSLDRPEKEQYVNNIVSHLKSDVVK